MEFNVLSDAAVGRKQDYLEFERYANPLLSILIHKDTQTPFTIGVFGTWGSGKSSLLRILDEHLKDDYTDSFVRVSFNPWLHRTEPNMLVPLLHTLNDTLQDDVRTHIKESAKKIGEVLLRMGADLLLKAVTFNSVSVEKLEALEKKYLEEKGKVESVMRKLHKTLQSVADEIGSDGTRIIFFIDDLDRCPPEQIIDLLEAVKLFLDLRNVFVILAVDKEVINRGIQIRYGAFKFGQDRDRVLGAEYLEKMVQLPLYLYPLSQSAVGDFICKLSPNLNPELQSLLCSQLTPNPRKIKRILNILTVTRALMDSTPELKNLDQDTVTRLVILQVQYEDFYADAVSNSNLLLAMEYLADEPGKAIRLNDRNDFLKYFGRDGDALQELCKKYYMVGSPLAQLFKDSAFRKDEVKQKLKSYMTMLGE